MTDNILVAVDLGVTTDRALDYATHLASKLGARVHVVHAIRAPLEVTRDGRARGKQELDAVALERQADLEQLVAARRGIATFGQLIAMVGDPREAIIACARELKADLVVVGSHGRRGVAHAILGSVAESVMRTAPCPVLTVRTEVA